MSANGSWIEWIACLVAAPAMVACYFRGRAWLIYGMLVLVAGWLAGTAKGLLFPALLGCLLFWFLWQAGVRWKRAGLAVALGGIVAGGFLCWLFPLPEIPVLSGPYAVGTLTFELSAEGSSPALVVQAWYPAREDKDAPRTPWLADAELAPKFPFHRIGKALARSRTGLDLSDASARYPVVFYEHSWTGHREENVAQVEDLASQGFVVIAADHPRQAGRVKYQDGTVVLTHLQGSFKLASEGEVQDFEKLEEKCLGERIRDLARIKQALGDGVPGPLAGRLVLEQAGVFGFSFGGTCALRLCAQDPWFHAGANEDGMFLGNEKLRGPFLFFDEQIPGWLLKAASLHESPEDAETRRSESRIRDEMGKPERFRVIMDGTRHTAFMDRIFTCRIPWLAHVGTQPAAEVHRIITSQLAGFFKCELLLHSSAPIPR